MMAGMGNIAMDRFTPPSAGDPVLTEVVRRLVAAYHPLRVYLFGSTARGDAGSDSDYDLMVVVSDEAAPELQDCRAGYRALSGLGIAKDIVVWTRAEFDKRLHLRASLPATVVEEGKLLYAA
jgi:predicted nucleotidyltransferase